MRFDANLLWKLMSETDKLKAVALWVPFKSSMYADSVKIAASSRLDDASPTPSNLYLAQSERSCDDQRSLIRGILAKSLNTASYLSPFVLGLTHIGSPVSAPVEAKK